FVRVTFFYRCAHDWPETFNRVLLVDDVPNLHKIGFLFSEFAYESARLIRRVYFDDWGITLIEFFTRDARDQGPGHGHPWRFGSCIRSFANFEIPKWPVNVVHACDSTSQVS